MTKEQAPDQIHQEQTVQQYMGGVKMAVMLGAAVGALIAGSAETANAAPKKLRTLQELPGLNKKVGLETRQKLNNSTVVLISRYKNQPASAWEKVCTATAVTMAGQKPEARLFMTAGHCFDVGDGSGVLDMPNNPTGAANFAGVLGKDYAFADINATQNIQKMSPMGFVSDVVINTKDTDVALLKAQKSDKIAQGAKTLDDIIPITYKRAKLTQGQQVAMYTSPSSVTTPIKTTGRYLGIINHRDTDNGPVRKIALVGISPKSQDKDGCLPGASGSSALAENGTVFGPLSYAVNFGYKQRPAVPSDTFASPDALVARNIWSNDLRVKLKEFPTICGYTVPPTNFEAQMLAGLHTPAENLGIQGS